MHLDMMLGWRRPLRRQHLQQLTRGKVEVQLLRQLQPAEMLRRLRSLGAPLSTTQRNRVPPRLRRMIH